MNPLETLIDQQAKLLVKMEQLMARDPSTEFARTEGSVGASKNFLPCPKVETWITNTNVARSEFVFSAGLYPQFWEVDITLYAAALAVNFSLIPFAKIEFDYSSDFTRPKTFIKPFSFTIFASSYTANTGGAILRCLCVFPIRYRFAKITLGTVDSGSLVFTARNGAGFWAGFGPFTTAVFGE